MSPFARSAKGPPPTPEDEIDTTPKKLEWKLTPDLRAGIRFAETRISDLICQNDSQALEFKGYGGTFIKRHGFSPDAFVQMAFQAAYYGLYGEFYFQQDVMPEKKDKIDVRDQDVWRVLMSPL